MTNADFVQVIAYIEVACGKPIYVSQPGETKEEAARAADYRIRVYFDLLGDLDREVFLAAAKKVALERQWPTFPTVAELRRAAAETTQGPALTPGDAWGLAWKAIGRIDPEVLHTIEKGLAGLPEAVRKAIDSFGLNSLCYAGKPATPVSVLRAQFERTFADRQEAEFRKALLPPALAKTIEQAPGALTPEQRERLDNLQVVKRDWRVGCSVKPKMRTHDLYYERGEVVEVLPSGTAGIHDKDGVLKIRMQTGRVLMAPADEWMTA